VSKLEVNIVPKTITVNNELELKVQLCEEDYNKILSVCNQGNLIINTYHRIYTFDDLPNYILRSQIKEGVVNGSVVSTDYNYGYKKLNSLPNDFYLDRDEVELDIPEIFFTLLKRTQIPPDFQFKSTCITVLLPISGVQARLDKITRKGIPDMFELEKEFYPVQGFELMSSIIGMFCQNQNIPYKLIQTPKYQRVWNAMKAIEAK